MTQFTIFLVLIVFVAFLLVVVIMVQNPKGGGLSSTFGGGGGQQLGGVKKTTDFLDKSTWTLAIILLALILLSNISLFDGQGGTQFIDQDQIENVTLPSDNGSGTEGSTEGTEGGGGQ
ncbi:MAG: preprotein translocase subunit SecG [Flavobacteriaceae bacterium]|nr:preprotein translocase subunit SecG [Flavobacteriaceae bacterium]